MINKNSRARGYRRCALAALSGLALALAACGSDGNDETVTSETSVTTSQVSTSAAPTTSATSTTDAAPEPSAPAALEPEVEEPVVAPERNSIWAPPGEGYNCPSTDAYVWDPADCNPSNGIMSPEDMWWLNGEPDPATIPMTDGGTCPAAICGYGHDENGNPNPTSGELQAQDGCEKEYITDPELCAAVAERFAE